MATKFDNLEDVSGKFVGTICYYGKDPILIETAQKTVVKDAIGFQLLARNGTKLFEFLVDDKEFRFRDFAVGYANHNSGAVWWYRKPVKQFRQGLRKDQMFHRQTVNNNGVGIDFGYSRSVIAMLRNEYPSLEAAMKAVRDGAAPEIGFFGSKAFHPNFAIAYDELHEDYILENRGVRVGLIRPDRTLRLTPDYKHLIEETSEVIANAG